MVDTILAELDGCEIRTVQHRPIEDGTQRTPVYNNPKKEKLINWRDVRLGFVRDLDSKSSKIFVGGMDSYSVVVSQMHSAAILLGMTPETYVVGIADGAPGLSDELTRQFTQMQFILDKTHLKDHLYNTAEELGIAKMTELHGLSRGYEPFPAVMLKVFWQNSRTYMKQMRMIV